jgi:hypothetical protein
MSEIQFSAQPCAMGILEHAYKEHDMKKFKSLQALAKSVSDDEMAAILNTCAVTGKKGAYGDDIAAAIVNVERMGIMETFRIVVHKSVKSGRKFRKGRIRSVKRAGMSAKVGTTKMGKSLKHYIVVTG